MSNKEYFFAVDLGATSGRTIIGTLEGSKFNLEELTRFNNNLIETGGHFYWDIYALYNEIINGLKIVHQRNIPIKSIGIDTWGCDFVYIGKDGAILRNPLAYRDPHTFGVMEKYFDQEISKEQVYDKTGIQFMNFNSLFQLYAMRQAGNTALENAEKILFIPDALSYMLTGNAVCEYTVASTSQILNPNTKDLDEDLIKSLGLKREQFGPMINPGEQIGVLTEEIQKMTGLGAIPVIAVAGHDTASAVAAVPAKDEKFAYLSSGTWSLMGIESKEPIINENSFDKNFTNEGGIEGTTRFLKNICGMWIYERCRKEWPEVSGMGHQQILSEAMQAEPFKSLINPDDKIFANPNSMVEAIQTYCKEHNEPVPVGYAAITRCIFESLALRYRQIFSWLKEFADFDINTLHIIGGGSLNQYLNQFTANSLGVKVLAGPQEGTAIGNIMLQAKAAGDVKDIWEMRRFIAFSLELKEFMPQDQEVWNQAYHKYLEITK
ncbi:MULTISPECIES: rhamnulokinase [Segatella]|jgi:rhamnulokinase|uniref:Rhamnulokinase n=2 Tax=Segatella TaxID=2974251 RepID=D8DYG4_9BACT|nr:MULTISPECIES: rhamnulokinase [Segatella]EFI71537.1 rhamnulokinase [Segatella baroniae B14]UKK77447.1 rhamnulokinase [Segatella baroniae B14]GJG26390.1 rhamnulokinase [Segatella bryantii]SEP55372.1 rhamnulokinase [Segatella baroniae B14]